MGQTLNNIGVVHKTEVIAIREELGESWDGNLNNIGIVHQNRGYYEKALDYWSRSLAIREGLGDMLGMGHTLNNIGIVHYNKGDYNKAAVHLEKSLAIQKEIGFKGLNCIALFISI